MKILLDYVFPISVITPTPEASTAFLKQVCVVATPKSGQEANVGDIFECSSMTEVAARTDNTNAQQLFDAGMTTVYVLLADDLYLTEFLEEGASSDFYTILISDDFDKDDMIDAQAEGTVTITSYANLVSGTDDVITIGGVAFTAQATAATLGTATFQAATSNDATATSLAAQINAHATAGALVTAEAASAIVTITANEPGAQGNDIAVSYTDNDTNVGATLGGLSGGNLSGGAGIDIGTYDGVIGVAESDTDFLEDQAAISQRVAFFYKDSNGAKNMFYAFGKLLSNSLDWLNQQYITMPVDDEVETLNDANNLFNDSISFVISDDEFGKRLALFAVGGKAIVAPYILKNLRVDLQSAALSWITDNQPDYTLKEASLLEARLQEDVINAKYIQQQGWIEAGTVAITLEEDNFVATGDINVAEPKALWRVFSEMRQTL
jgi:hypothetical protein